MSISIIKNLHNIAASEEKHLLEVYSNKYSNLGFKYKIDYYKEGTNDVLHTQRMAPNPDLSGNVSFNVHNILKHYVDIDKTLQLNQNWYKIDKQQYKYDIKITEEYIEEHTIIDHLYVLPYATQGKTVFKTQNNNTYQIGDVVNINITSITYTPDPSQESSKLETIQNAYNGVHTITDILDNKQFAIQVPFATSTSTTSGNIHYNDMRLKTDATNTITNKQVIYSKPKYNEVYDTNTSTYSNNFTNFNRYVGTINRQIYDWQDMFILLLENKTNTVRKVVFNTPNKSAYYSCSDSNAITKMINVNPNHCTLIGYLDSEPFLDNEDYYDIELYDTNNILLMKYRYTLLKECPIFKHQLLFIDDYGALQSFGVTLQQDGVIDLKQNNHVRKDTYFDYDTVVNTNNQSEATLNVRMDWLTYSEYKYSEQLFRSSYIWLKDETGLIRPVIINETSLETKSKHNQRYDRKINIRLA